MQFTNVHLNFSGILLKIGWTCSLWQHFCEGHPDWVPRCKNGVPLFTVTTCWETARMEPNILPTGLEVVSKCLIVHQGWLPSNPGEQMCFQTTADLDTLSNYSRRARWGGGGIGWTKDDIISMILALNQEWSTCCMASSDSVELWPWTKLKRPADVSVFLSFAFHTIL